MSPSKADELKDTDFRFNDARTEVQCIVCSALLPPALRSWILVKNGGRHLRSEPHAKAVRALQGAREEVAHSQAGAVPDSRARNPTIAPRPHVVGPVQAKRGRGSPSVAEVEMWRDYAESGANFSAGDEPTERDAAQGRLQREADVFGILDAEGAARRLGMGDETLSIDDLVPGEDEEDFLAEVMQNWGPRQALAGEFHPGFSNRPDPDSSDAEYFPYPNKTMFLLDLLDNFPRLRVSHSLMRVFLWILSESGVRDVPSLDALHKFQKKLRSASGIPSISCMSPLGNVFFMNDPRAIIAQDWSNPATRKLIRVYPEIPDDGVVREIWHAQKWRKSMDLDALSPMYDAGSGVHYFVNEVARMRDGTYVVPVRWLTFRNSVFADAFHVEIDAEVQTGEATINQSKTTLIAVAELQHNFLALEDLDELPRWTITTAATGLIQLMPNPKRKIANGVPLYTSFVDYFGDDVSGNRTKSWNKHWNAYMSHRNLPRCLLQQEFHTHFISTSPNATISEQFREFKAAIKETHTDPVRVQDEHGQTTCFSIYCNAGPSDNPMQSEISSHIGARGNCFCRKCIVGGTQAQKMQEHGYHALFEPGVPRNKVAVLAELRRQVQLVCSGKSVDDLVLEQRKTGVKDAYTQQWIVGLEARYTAMRRDDPDRTPDSIKTELMQWTDANEAKLYSAFLTTESFDPTVDTPIELLHTILLGAVKYVWHISHTSWDATKKQIYSQRLQATETDGLSIHAIRAKYIMQYAGSLIGKQFKTIVQTGVFHVHDIVSDEYMTVWRALGELSAMLWFTEIRKPTEYAADLRTAVANLLDAISVVDPSKIITKVKYHLLAHSPDDATEFGPLIGMATEIYESFNAVFRYSSILSNHLAPSRDIALQLGDQEGLKHRLTGGLWHDSATDSWERAGPGIRSFLQAHPILQRLLGWTPERVQSQGDLKLTPLKRGVTKRELKALSRTSAALAVNYGDYSADSQWDTCASVLSASLDECRPGSWIFFALNENEVFCARILEILTSIDAGNIAVVEPFAIQPQRDAVYGMPVLTRHYGEALCKIIPLAAIRFIVNVQHDCREAKCDASGTRAIIQERVESDKTEAFIIHKSLDRYILNTHAFHNAALLRATLPRHLWAPIPLFDDRKLAHAQFSAKLRQTKEARKVQLAARRAARKGKPTPAATDPASTVLAPSESHPRKRQRSRLAGSDSDDPGPARKRARARAHPKAKPKPKPPVVVAVSLAITGDTSLAAGRAKRTIRKTEKAMAAEQDDSEGSGGEEGGSGSEEDDEEGGEDDESEFSE